MWYVGQKVVCINPDFKKLRVIPLELNKVYTVRAIYLGKGYACDGIPLFHLMEVTNTIRYNPIAGQFEPGYRTARFRPLLEKKTDISCFTSLLNEKEFS